MTQLCENETLEKRITKAELALSLGLSRQALYYKPRLPAKDLALKVKIVNVLNNHPAYGHKRIAIELMVNKKRIRRVMNKFNLRPYKRRVRKPPKPADQNKAPTVYRNLIKYFCPTKPNIVWVADFTYISFQGRFIYLSTVMDLFTREILGWNVSGSHDRYLVLESLNMAIGEVQTLPLYHHSDQGSEYDSCDYIKILDENKITVSMSKKGHPWENAFQESFYSQFKVDLGWPNQYETWGELIEAIHLQINYYNKSRIHTSLKTSPIKFREQYYIKSLTISMPRRQRQLV